MEGICMEYKDMNNPIDVEFEEDTSTRYINGKPIYWNTSQVAEQLGIESSAVRYYCDCFSDFIKVKRSGRNRKFTDKNIEQLRFIKKLLKEDNLTIGQAKEFLTVKDSDVMQHKIEKEEPLPTTVLANMIGNQISQQLDDMKIQIVEDLIQKMSINFQYQNEIQQQIKEDLKNYIAITIDEKLDTSLQEIKSCLESQEQLAQQRDTELLDKLRKGMEEHRKQNEKRVSTTK